ncbi:hypothetical protein LJC59_01705 [Desulfovibrio sp. OttesenSCG-928-A18]|nr:hypothetical protein [Desulfovibrio sp. OttesenSCG-928-A18]
MLEQKERAWYFFPVFLQGLKFWRSRANGLLIRPRTRLKLEKKRQRLCLSCLIPGFSLTLLVIVTGFCREIFKIFFCRLNQSSGFVFQVHTVAQESRAGFFEVNVSLGEQNGGSGTDCHTSAKRQAEFPVVRVKHKILLRFVEYKKDKKGNLLDGDD